MNDKHEFLFTDILQKGLGRAFDYVKQYLEDRDRLRKDLLNACLNNLAYDAQSESSRAKYLFELINLTGDIDFYRGKIFEALLVSEDRWDIHWDIKQLYDLVLIWAKKDDIRAREIIYQTFRKQKNNTSWLGGEQIIELDGIEGLLNVAEIFGENLLQDNELWEDDWLIVQARELYGTDEVNSALEESAVNNIKVKAYLDAVKTHEAKNKVNRGERGKKNKNIPLDRILELIESSRNSWYILYKFGTCASDRDIEMIFDRLLKETRKKQLRNYLWIFKARPLPRLDNRLFDLAISEDEEIQYCAIAAINGNKNDTIRELAINLIKQPEAITNGILALFIDNYQIGDYQVIESALEQSQDMEFRHRAGMDLINIIKTQKNPELINCSFWIYENTPCAHCRESILEILIDSKQITSDILQECKYDSSPDIRTLAQSFKP